MKKIGSFALLFLFTMSSCTSSKTTVEELETKNVSHYLQEISKEHLIEHLSHLASDAMEGRKTGEPGQKKAADYLRTFYKKNKITAAQNTLDYYQNVPSSFMVSSYGPTLKDSENVIAFIEGSEYPEEYLVLSAHYDHMGIENGKIFYGADDNASGTAAVMEMARVFQQAKLEGNGPKRSIIIAHFTGEEFGLFGSKFYTEHPLYPLQQTFADLNIDMIGRVDPAHQNNINYLYLVGSDKISTALHQLSEKANQDHTQLDLDYKYNAPNDPEMIYYRSDHYNFAKHNIPVIFYFDGIHEDYHQPTDTAEKINYDLMRQRTQLIFATAWQLANQPEKIKPNL